MTSGLGDDTVSDRETTLREGRAHQARGWPVFLLATDGPEGKIPPRNCERCDPRTGERHDRETCECLLCHGFYAATLDPVRFGEMVERLPRGYLAIRTGSRARVMVLDVEAAAVAEAEADGLTILQVLSQITGVELPETLTATSVSGGLHLFYSLDEGQVITSGRVLPNVDVKAEGGLVGAVGSRSGKRRWLDSTVSVAPLPRAMVDWLVRNGRRGSGGGGGGTRQEGYDFREFESRGCPGGHRDDFFNDLLFRERKKGATAEQLWVIARHHWEQCGQPDREPWADYYMPWEHVAYKVQRVVHEVEPEPLSDTQELWVASVIGVDNSEVHVTGNGTRTRRVGRATVIARSGGEVWS